MKQYPSKFIPFIFGMFVITACGLAFAQNGNNDLSFNPTDLGFGVGEGAGGSVYASAVQSDGKIIIVGSFSSYNTVEKNYIARLNSDGTLDNTFNSAGLGASSTINSVAIQPDGKILIGGVFTSYNGSSRPRIARLNADGTLDSGFAPGTGANSQVNSIVVQSDGKIILGGSFTSYNGTNKNRIARLNSDGSLDNTFTVGTASSSGFNNIVRRIALQSDGKILVVGEFTTFNGTTRNRSARLNSDGSLDSSWNPGTGANAVIHDLAIQTDGKVIIGGDFTAYGSTSINRLARLNSNGTLDTGYSPGTAANGIVRTTRMLENDKILIGGNFTTFNGTTRNRVARINSDGSLDTNFDPSIAASHEVWQLLELSSGKILVCGDFTQYNNAYQRGIVRINANGLYDTSFNPSTGANNIIYASAIQSDGKIIIGGQFTTFNGVSRNFLARLNSDGSLDNTFNIATGANNTIYAIGIQSDGKILIGGDFTSFAGLTRNRIARINSNGSVDTTFDPSGGVSNTVRAIAVNADGKIYIGGSFTFFNTTSRNRVARLNANGTLDTNFAPDTGANGDVYAIQVQADGKVLIGGAFTTYRGATRNRIARINTNGTLDTTFSPGTGASSTVWSIIVMADQKILIAGNLTSFNGTTRNRIARLTTTGGLETAFNPDSGPNNTIFTMALQSDGKIVIGGQFTTYQGDNNSRNRVARINSNGTLDLTFNPGSGANNTVRTVNVQSDGKIVVAGEFNSFKGLGRNRITRVVGTCSNLTGIDSIESSTAVTWINGVTYTQSNNSATYTLTNSSGCDSIVTLNLTITPPVVFDVNATNNQICSGDEVTISVGFLQGILDDLDCSNSLFSGNIVENYSSNGITMIVNYNNGNGGIHNGQVVNSNGVSGLTATLAPGSFLVGQGSLVYNISGTPTTSGIASFELNIGGQSCTINRTVWPLPVYPDGYVHCNPSNPTQVIDVTNPVTGQIWMDRNLGANRAAISSTDAEAYGSLFQWGRFADGHQCVNRYSGDGVTTSGTTTTLSTTATPSHGNFIAVNNAQWQSPTVNNLWQGANGINNPCPVGYRVPTQSELNAERLSWQQPPINSTNNIAGGFASPLKLTMGGRRNNSDGSVTNVGNYGSYWSSTAQAFEETSLDLFVNTNNQASVEWNHNRSNGVSVRCIKD